MISEKDKKIIITYAKKFNVKEIYLFGSCLDKEREANDIDLAVRGVAPALFFDFYGKLLRYLSKPVDIVNLSKKSRFTEWVERQAVKIYG
ncbi:MAG: nucleotidyltransferase family protein [bacterium]